MKYVVQGKYVSEHGEHPGNGVQVGNEPYPIQVVEQNWVVKCLCSRKVLSIKTLPYS